MMGQKNNSYFYCILTCLLERVNYFQIFIDYIYSSRHCLFISFVDFFLIGLFVFFLFQQYISAVVLSRSVVSDSFRPHRLQPARLLCPWGFSKQEYWSGWPCPPPGHLPNPGIEPSLLHCRRILHCLSHQGSPVYKCRMFKREKKRTM